MEYKRYTGRHLVFFSNKRLFQLNYTHTYTHTPHTYTHTLIYIYIYIRYVTRYYYDYPGGNNTTYICKSISSRGGCTTTQRRQPITNRTDIMTEITFTCVCTTWVSDVKTDKRTASRRTFSTRIHIDVSNRTYGIRIGEARRTPHTFSHANTRVQGANGQIFAEKKMQHTAVV